MNFGQAVQSAFRQYAGFSGRARRSEYWFFFLFNLLLSIVVGIIDVAIGSAVLGYLLTLALLLPGLAVGCRRLHDTGRPGAWLFIALIPLIGVIVLLVFFCQDSQPGDNQYGPSPKYNAGPAGGYGQQAPGYGT